MLDAQIKIAAEALGVTRPEDWSNFRPEQIRAIHGCGPATVDHLRLYLAARGLTLRDDATPAYWQQNLASARIGGQTAKTDTAVVAPFVVLVDTAEQHPWQFQGFRADADQKFRPLLVQCRNVHLGPTHGDYSMEGAEGECHLERKSQDDAAGTFLSHGERRERWERTLEFLASCKSSAVIIECTMGKLIAELQSRGSRPKQVLQKTIHRQVLAWEQDYRVPFVFCDSRRLAELSALAILQRHYRHAHDMQAQRDRELDKVIAEM